MHSKLPSDEKLSSRGCCLPSICSFCGNLVESTQHLLQVNLFGTGSAPLYLCRSTITQFLLLETCAIEIDINNVCKLVVLAALVNRFNVVWYCRNQRRFSNSSINLRIAIHLIILGTSLSGNNAKLTANSSIREFVVLEAFSVKIHNPKGVIIKEVFLHPPIL